MRAASNPPNRGLGTWVKDRFGIYRPDGDPDPRRLCHRREWVAEHDRAFLPSRLHDNRGLDHDAYTRQLLELDPVTAAQLLRGDWDVTEPGEFFNRAWFEIIDQ